MCSSDLGGQLPEGFGEEVNVLLDDLEAAPIEAAEANPFLGDLAEAEAPAAEEPNVFLMGEARPEPEEPNPFLAEQPAGEDTREG